MGGPAWVRACCLRAWLCLVGIARCANAFAAVCCGLLGLLRRDFRFWGSFCRFSLSQLRALLDIPSSAAFTGVPYFSPAWWVVRGAPGSGPRRLWWWSLMMSNGAPAAAAAVAALRWGRGVVFRWLAPRSGALFNSVCRCLSLNYFGYRRPADTFCTKAWPGGRGVRLGRPPGAEGVYRGPGTAQTRRGARCGGARARVLAFWEEFRAARRNPRTGARAGQLSMLI